MELLEHDCGRPDSLHPGSVPDVLCDESSPNRNRFQRAASRGCFKPDYTRVLVTVNAKVMEEVSV